MGVAKLRRIKVALILSSIAAAFIAYISSSDSTLSFQLHFPASTDLGELWLVEDVNCFTCGTGEKRLGRATGTYDVQLPSAHWFISLRLPADVSHLLTHLQDASLMKIGDLQLQGSNIKDEDLRYIAGINLRSINLSNTDITGEGLKHLKQNESWMSVNLSNCNALEPEYLSHFKGWRQSTIRLTSNKRISDKPIEAERRLFERAKQIICEGYPEGECGTQLR